MRFIAEFPSQDAAVKFLHLVASNSPSAWGLGLGLEFENLEMLSGGRLLRTLPGKRAAGDKWQLVGGELTMVVDYISEMDSEFYRLRRSLEETAHKFGGHTRWSNA